MNKITSYFIHIRAYIIYVIIYEKNIIFYKKIIIYMNKNNYDNKRIYHHIYEKTSIYI